MHHPSPPVLLTPFSSHCSWSRSMPLAHIGHPFGLEGSWANAYASAARLRDLAASLAGSRLFTVTSPSGYLGGLR